VLSFTTLARAATTVTQTGTGGDIPDAEAGTGVPGTFISDIVVTAPGTLPTTGNNVIVTLIGLQHPWAGDLVVTLTRVTEGTTADIFNRLGASSRPPLGFNVNFGGNYDFNSSSANDLWNTVSALGDADTIPENTYFAVTSGHTPSALSSAFNGLAAAGTWRLKIMDMAIGPDTPDPFPQFTGWKLTLTVNDTAYTVSATPTSVAPGGAITMNWSAPAGHSPYDWIGLYQTGTANTQFLWWTYTGAATSGNASVAAPSAPGSYEFRYLTDNSYTDVARSATVNVTAATGPVISAVTASGITASSANITWATDVLSDSQADYGTALTYSLSSPLNSTLVTSHAIALSGLSSSTLYHYRVKSRNSAGILTLSGDFTFTTAASTSYSVSASPSSVAPGATINLSWTALSGSSPYDWIGLFPAGSANTGYVWWQYTGGATTGNVMVTAPAASGSYEFRYLLNNGFTDVARSNTITVGSASAYTVTASPTTLPHGSTITVNWTAPNGHSPYDWIGLYATGAANTQFLWWTYTGPAISGSVPVTAPATPGTYEFRYLLNNGYTDAARSATVTVQ
jgi:hypothetical protein